MVFSIIYRSDAEGIFDSPHTLAEKLEYLSRPCDWDKTINDSYDKLGIGENARAQMIKQLEKTAQTFVENTYPEFFTPSKLR